MLLFFIDLLYMLFIIYAFYYFLLVLIGRFIVNIELMILP